MSASLAFVFPGQGSQSLGMLAELGAEKPVIIETFKEASDALGYDLWKLIQEGPEEQLNQTDKTQPPSSPRPSRYGACGWRRVAPSRPSFPVTAWVNTAPWLPLAASA